MEQTLRVAHKYKNFPWKHPWIGGTCLDNAEAYDGSDAGTAGGDADCKNLQNWYWYSPHHAENANGHGHGAARRMRQLNPVAYEVGRARQLDAANVVENNAPGVGSWGGTCTCPDGQVYQVGDNFDSCKSLACYNGFGAGCSSNNPGGQKVKVTCAGEKKECEDGIVGTKHGDKVCCASSCGVCTGDTGNTCGGRPGGKPQCCPGTILNNDVYCSSSSQTGCILGPSPPNTAPPPALLGNYLDIANMSWFPGGYGGNWQNNQPNNHANNQHCISVRAFTPLRTLLRPTHTRSAPGTHTLPTMHTRSTHTYAPPVALTCPHPLRADAHLGWQVERHQMH